MSIKRKPDIPAEFKRINGAMGVYYILHGLVLWYGSATAGYLLWQAEGVPLWLKAPALLLLAVLSGFGMFFLALQGHEGFHGNMNQNRDVSMLMGIFASAVAPGFVSTGYNVMHWQHHMHTNTDDDPDYLLYRNNKTFLSRVLFGPFATATICLKNALRLIFAPEGIDRSFPFSRAKGRFYASLNLLLMLSVLFGYGLIAYHFGATVFVFFVALPVLFGESYWALAPYIEHSGAGVDDNNNSRTVTSNVLKVLLVGYNFHLCHHMYPRVQLHKLPALFRYLESNGHLPAQPVVEKSLVGALRIGAVGGLEF